MQLHEPSRQFEKRNFQGMECNGTTLHNFSSSAKCQQTIYNRDVAMSQILNSRVSGSNQITAYSKNQVVYPSTSNSSSNVSGSNSLTSSDYMLPSAIPPIASSQSDAYKTICVIQNQQPFKSELIPSQGGQKSFLTSLPSKLINFFFF
jgi:hypothetical protein